jgi:hypothetical protein
VPKLTVARRSADWIAPPALVGRRFAHSRQPQARDDAAADDDDDQMTLTGGAQCVEFLQLCRVVQFSCKARATHRRAAGIVPGPSAPAGRNGSGGSRCNCHAAAAPLTNQINCRRLSASAGRVPRGRPAPGELILTAGAAGSSRPALGAAPRGLLILCFHGGALACNSGLVGGRADGERAPKRREALAYPTD